MNRALCGTPTTARIVAIVSGMIAVCGVVLDGEAARAQASASFHVTDAVLDAGGSGSPPPASGSFRITRSSLAEPFAVVAAASATFRLDDGALAAIRPAGEVRGVVFTDPTTLVWHADPSGGDYAVYRGAIDTLPGGFGDCLAHGMSLPAHQDPVLPDPGSGAFYLVTARNRLREEGTKGAASDGNARANSAPCP